MLSEKQRGEIISSVRNTVPSPLLIHISGSHAYGMATPASDLDVRGLFCADRQNVTTPFFPLRQQTISDLEDAEMWEMAKYLQLYTQGNPNIIESLWVAEEDVLYQDEVIKELVHFREALLSKKVAFTYSGYAMSQLKRMKGHKRHITNPQPKEPPQHKDYVKLIQNFSDAKIMPGSFDINVFSDHNLIHYGNDIYGITLDSALPSVFTKGRDFNVCANVKDYEGRATPWLLVKYCKEEYKRAKKKHEDYWAWKNSRNEKRKKMEEDFGFDGKHASHLVRLLRQAEEILSGEGVIVKRPDAKELLDIRKGLWDYEDLIKWAEEKDDYVRGELYHNSLLPQKPYIKLASKLLIDIQNHCWRD